MSHLASVIVGGLLLGFLAIGNAGAEAQRPARGPLGERDLVVVNKGDQAMNEIYVSPSSADAWGEDRLGDAVLAPNESIRIRLGRSRDCTFDVQVIYEDASREQRLAQNICRDRRLTFTGEGAVAAPAVAGAEHRVVLRNDSPRAIQQIFISPADASEWGDDLLPDRRVSVGEEVALTYRGACAADLRVVFDNRAAEERRGLDLCATPALDIRPGWTTAAEAPVLAEPGLRLVNQSGHAVLEFRLAPEGAAGPAAGRGHDLLGPVALDNGDAIQLPWSRAEGCRFDAHVAFDGGAAARDLAGLDLCADPVVTLAP